MDIEKNYFPIKNQMNPIKSIDLKQNQHNLMMNNLD